MTQDGLRKIVLFLHDELGMAYTFIGKKCNLSGSMINFFAKGDRNLSEESIKNLIKFIENIRKEVEKL